MPTFASREAAASESVGEDPDRDALPRFRCQQVQQFTPDPARPEDVLLHVDAVPGRVATLEDRFPDGLIVLVQIPCGLGTLPARVLHLDFPRAVFDIGGKRAGKENVQARSIRSGPMTVTSSLIGRDDARRGEPRA